MYLPAGGELRIQYQPYGEDASMVVSVRLDLSNPLSLYPSTFVQRQKKKKTQNSQKKTSTKKHHVT